MLPIAHSTVNLVEARCIALGGGGGGVGRSTIARALATELRQRGRSVLLVDGALHGGVQHLDWPVAWDAHALHQDLGHYPDRVHKAIIPGDGRTPALLSLSLTRGGAAFPSRLRAQALVQALREGPWDDILFDLDGRADGFNASIMALADRPIFVSTPEAASLDQSIEMMRQFIVYRLLLQPEADTVERRLLDALESLPARYDLQALVDAFTDTSLRPLLDHVLHTSTPWLILNQCRNANERLLVHAIAFGCNKMTGLRPRTLGALGWDEERGDYIRSGSLHHPLQGPGDTIADIAQRLLHLADEIEAQPRLPYNAPHSAFDIVGVSQTAPTTDVRRAWRTLWDGLRQNSNFTRYILPADTREQLLYELEEANRELQPWLATQSSPRGANTTDRAPASTLAVIQKIRQARHQKEWTAQDLSLRCRIGIRYLEAIEAFEIDALPREVYLRGYLREIARALDLPENQIVDPFMEAFYAHRSQAIQER